MSSRAKCFGLFLLIGSSLGCPPPTARQLERRGAAVTTPAKAPRPVISLEGRTLEFVPSRADFSVGRAVFSLHCSRPTEVRLNENTPERSWNYIELEQVAKNEFRLPGTAVTAPADHTGLICISIKVWFNEVDNKYDSPFYANVEDRYALVSFATHTEGADWERARPRFSQNRVETPEELARVLSRPIRIELNQRPLSDVEEWRMADERRSSLPAPEAR